MGCGAEKSEVDNSRAGQAGSEADTHKPGEHRQNDARDSRETRGASTDWLLLTLDAGAIEEEKPNKRERANCLE
jgi:hypothetical protein